LILTYKFIDMLRNIDHHAYEGLNKKSNIPRGENNQTHSAKAKGRAETDLSKGLIASCWGQRKHTQLCLDLRLVGEGQKQALVEFEGCVNLTALDVGLGVVKDLREGQLNLSVSPTGAVGSAACRALA
jgi:hypothetical protein